MSVFGTHEDQDHVNMATVQPRAVVGLSRAQSETSPRAAGSGDSLGLGAPRGTNLWSGAAAAPRADGSR